MRLQIWIIGAAFSVFGVVAWIVTSWSPSYLGLIVFGLFIALLGYLLPQ